MAKEEWLLGQGFRSASNDETDTEGQQAGEVEYHGESLTGGAKAGYTQSTTPGSVTGRSGRRVGVKVEVNGFGGGVKSKKYPDGQAVSNALDLGTGQGYGVVQGEDPRDQVAPPMGHSEEMSGYGKPR